jgi:arginine decarboxylase
LHSALVPVKIRPAWRRKDGARRARAAREETAMTFWKQVTKASATAGTAEGGTSLNAFDNALLAAGIGNVNLVKVSSIMPPDVDIVDLPRIKPGALVPTAYAAMTSETPGDIVTAAVGYALPEDRTKAGVIMEFHDRGDRAAAERAIRAMLAEAFAVRGETIREMKVVAVDHRVQRIGCALAAVALLSDDDLV